MTKRRISAAARLKAEEKIRAVAAFHGLRCANFVRYRTHQTGEYLVGVYRSLDGCTITITVPMGDEG